jgi:hypothetical protein
MDDGKGLARVANGGDSVEIGHGHDSVLITCRDADEVAVIINAAHEADKAKAVKEAMEERDAEIKRLKIGLEHFQRVAGLPASNDQIREAVERAREEERERCCREICSDCAGRRIGYKSSPARFGRGGWTHSAECLGCKKQPHKDVFICKAADIRRRSEEG